MALPSRDLWAFNACEDATPCHGSPNFDGVSAKRKLDFVHRFKEQGRAPARFSGFGRLRMNFN